MAKPMIFFALTVLIVCAPSLYFRGADIAGCVLISLLLILAAGLRSSGSDYGEYLFVFEIISRAEIDDIDSLMAIAKDPLFFVTVFPITVLTDNRDYVFLLLATLSVVPKTLLALSLPRYSALFIAGYALLLAPTLEFAAIRSGMALGMCALLFLPAISLRTRIGAGIAAALSHISAVAAVGAYFFSERRDARITAVLFLLAIVGTYAAITNYNFLYELDLFAGTTRAGGYEGEIGTLNNLIFPTITALLTIAAYRWLSQFKRDEGSDQATTALYVSFILSGSALGAAVPLATYVIRVLEFSWFCYLFGSLRAFGLNGVAILRSGFILWIVFMVLLNIVRDSWVLMDPWPFTNL